MDQPAPGLEPVLFAPGIVSIEDREEYGSVFSPDGREFYFAVRKEEGAIIYVSRFENDAWTIPETMLPNEKHWHNDPFFSPDGNRLYFISERPMDGEVESKDVDIWYVERQDGGWSDPINAGPNINSDRNEYYMSFTQNGTMYFSSNIQADTGRLFNFDMYASSMENGMFQPPERLSDSLNSRGYEADVYIAPDESYIIFCAFRREGMGEGDLYVSFKNPDGSWKKAKNMGAPVNSEKHELCPAVTPDGKYLFYTSGREIYWVSTEILEQYR